MADAWIPNADNTPIEVSHADLQRCSASPFRSQCPVCEDGVLLVQRDVTSLRIKRRDVCISCGQRFIYVDDTINGETFHEGQVAD